MNGYRPITGQVGYSSKSGERIRKLINDRVMALFRVTVKQMKNTNGIRVEKGMSVEVVTNSLSNPLTTNGGQAVADAFYRIYGIDAQKAGILSTVYLDVQRIR